MPIKEWPADKVEKRSIDTLVPYVNNARTHSDEQVAQIAASMKEWGWTNPVLIDDDGMIIAGHGRVMAARKLGITDVPVMVASDWTEAQKKAYVLADNQLALNAGWDLETLGVELKGLADLDFDIGLMGFGDDFLANAMADRTEGLTDPDGVPDTPENAVTVAGDLWILGNHRLVCGDSTNATDVEKVLGPVKPHLMVTDPPYGVEYDASWRIEHGWSREISRGVVSNDDVVSWQKTWALFPGDVAYVWHASLAMGDLVADLAECDFNPRAQIIWAKQDFVFSRGDYHWQHETCLYAVKKGCKGHYSGGRKQTTIWEIANAGAFKGSGSDDKRTGHSTQKPVECMRRPIVNNSSAGQAVYDPFLGSGTTLIAAEMEGRHCYGLELHPPYCDVIIKRWQDFTGQQATHEDGRTFDEIAAERQ